MKPVHARIVKKWGLNPKMIKFRYPKMGDVGELLEQVNSLVGEGARILVTQRQTRKSEAAWLRSKLSEIRSGKTIMLIAEAAGKIAGSGEIHKRMAEKNAASHVATFGFWVSREYRGQGIGEMLARELIKAARREWKTEIVTSSYSSDNIASTKLHKKLGFRVTGTIPNGVKYGNKYYDEIIAVKKL